MVVFVQVPHGDHRGNETRDDDVTVGSREGAGAEGEDGDVGHLETNSGPAAVK